MNANDFLPYLGKTDDMDEIIKLLAQLGVSKHPKLKKGEMSVFVELPQQGLVLVFSREQEGKTSKLTLTDLQFYSEAFGHGFSSFAGQLPHGLMLTDLKDEVRRKLGEPKVANDEMGVDIWTFDGYNLPVEFRPATGAIRLLHLSLPPKSARA